MLSIPNLVIAFIAGFLTFFAGCLAPIVPVYISFLAGATSEELDRPTKKLRAKTFFHSILFVAGFIGIFIFLGLTVNTFARHIAQYRLFLIRIGGIIMVLFGLHLSHIFHFRFLYHEKKLSTTKLKQGTAFGSFLLGSIFGFSWTPCIGPVLATILFWAGSQHTSFQALILLIAFSTGLALPFLAIGLLFDRLMHRLKIINTHGPIIQKISGIILIIFGILLITNQFAVISGFLLKYLGTAAFVVELRQ